jgi:hypothetical protein
MAAITPATVVTLTDKVGAAYIAAIGTDASTYGLGTVGATARAYKKASDLLTLVLATSDNDQIIRMLAGAQSTMNNVDALFAMQGPLTPFLAALTDTCKSAGLAATIKSLDDFATYYNLNATPWQCLFAPDYAQAHKAWKGAMPTNWNTYFEVLQGATYANGLRKLVVVGSTQTAGQDIDNTLYAGGFGQITWSGATGTGVVTVTGTWRKIDGTIETAAGTASLSGASGTAVLTPPTANDLLLTVTSVSAAAGVTAGTIYAEAKRPTGRTNPPT